MGVSEHASVLICLAGLLEVAEDVLEEAAGEVGAEEELQGGLFCPETSVVVIEQETGSDLRPSVGSATGNVEEI